MATPRLRFIPELLEVHAADLAFLWDQRRAAMTSRHHTLREFGELNERIEAHLQGLLVAPPDVLLALLQPQLAADDRGAAFAAGYTLLRLEQPILTQRVVEAFERAQGEALDGLCDALSAAAFGSFVGAVQDICDRAAPRTAVAAAAVLANHRLLTSHSARLPELLLAEDPRVCALAWSAVAVTDARDPTLADGRPYRQGLSHASLRVRHAAWAAAAWTGRSQCLPLLRQSAESGDQAALLWLAVLGEPDDVARLQQAALALDDADLRCALLARYGHPSGLNALVRWMDADAPAQAAAAGAAFERITGLSVHGERQALPVPDDADAFDREMAPLVWLPDAQQARRLMKQHGPDWAEGTRWCLGRRLDVDAAATLLGGSDLELRWDIGARAAMSGHPVCPPPPVH